jgi:hypothetical protein
MTSELLAMFGGSAVGFIMKLLAAQQQNQAAQFNMVLRMQEMADESADKAAARGGIMMRRLITCVVLFAIVIVPTVIAFTDVGVSIQKETNGLLGLFKSTKWETVGGYVILPEVRQTALAIVGFYFGSSQVK